MAENLKPWTPLGVAIITNTPKSLTTLFPNFANQNNNVYTVCIQNHETLNASTITYIGDGKMTAGNTEAGFVLKGPLDHNKFENQGALNSLDLDEFYLMANVAESAVRVYVLMG